MRAAAAIILVLCVACGLEGGPQASAPPPTSAAPAAEATASLGEPTGVPATSKPTAPPGCRNSTSSSCGPFRFDPDPQDDEVRVRVTYSPTKPKPGDKVTFTLRATDPDSPQLALGTYRFGPRSSAHVVRQDPSSCPRGFGPWDPPPAAAGSKTQTISYTYPDAGVYEATFTFTSSSGASKLPGDDDGRCIDPYGSSGKSDVTVRIG